MKKCLDCGRVYDDSWRVCLYCRVGLKDIGEDVQEDEDLGWGVFSGNKFAIVFFSILLMAIAPILVFVVYLSYFQALDLDDLGFQGRQLKEAIVFDEKDAKKKPQ